MIFVLGISRSYKVINLKVAIKSDLRGSLDL